MRRLLPNRTDLAIFAAAAMLCAAIVSSSPALDLSLSAAAIPIFVSAAVLGMYRTGRLSNEDFTAEEADE